MQQFYFVNELAERLNGNKVNSIKITCHSYNFLSVLSHSIFWPARSSSYVQIPWDVYCNIKFYKKK